MFRFIIFFIFFWKIEAVDWAKVIQQLPEQNLQRIEGGASNENYLLKLDEGDYFVRISPRSVQSLYSDLEIEYRTLKELCDLDVSPKPVYFDLEKRILITEYLQSEKKAIDLLDLNIRRDALNLVKKIESSGVKIFRSFYPYEDIFQLVKTAESLQHPLSEEFYSILMPALKRIDALISNDPKNTLCHLDLHQYNLLKARGRYWIIDWEYATMSHPFMVLASMASIERWGDEQMRVLLNEYVECPSSEDYNRLYLYRIVADIFWTAWNHVQTKESQINMPYPLWKQLFQEAAIERVCSNKFEEALREIKKHEA